MESNLNPAAQRLHTQYITLSSINFAPGNAARIYFPYIPQIETGQMVGLFSLCALVAVNGEAPNIATAGATPDQFNTAFVNGFNYNPYLFVTIVDKKGEVLFEKIPYSLLFPVKGKIHRFNAVNIDSRKCYFSLPSGLPLTGNITAALSFYMNYQ